MQARVRVFVLESVQLAD